MLLSNWRVLLRRWYVVVLGVQVTGLLCALALHFVPTKYEATSTALMLPPKSSTPGQPDNVFLNLGGLDTVAGVVARAVTDKAHAQQVFDAGGTGSYTVEPDLASGGPVLLITVQDTTPEATLNTLDVVAKLVPQTLRELQTTAGVRESALIRSRELTRDASTVPVRKTVIRALLVAVAAGLAGTVIVTSLVDGYLLRRAERRSRLTAAAARDVPTALPRTNGSKVPHRSPAERLRAPTGGHGGNGNGSNGVNGQPPVADDPGGATVEIVRPESRRAGPA